MALGTWWHDDPLPDLSPLAQFCACASVDTPLVARLTGLSQQEIKQRFQSGNLIYIAWIGEMAVAYGWVATQEGYASEIHLFFKLPARNRYLWDFKTLPEWRGRGIYAHLLHEIVLQERQQTDRFWILYASDNDMSGRGIRKAGFRIIGDLVFVDGRAAGVVLFESSERARTAATVLNLPIVWQK